MRHLNNLCKVWPKLININIYFLEICHRLQTARPSVIKCLLYYLLPWLYNLELVDPNVSPESEVRVDPQQGRGREGWGSSEATEMITNNLFYITVKVRLKKECKILRNQYKVLIML